MASNTENLNLLMKNPSTDGADTFNVQTMLNENWQKIDNNAGNVAQTLANILKPTTPPIIGLPPSTTPDGMFRALGNTGELHVWRKTVTTSQEIPAGYTLGDVQTNINIFSGGRDVQSILYYNDTPIVDDGGNVTANDGTGNKQYAFYANGNYNVAAYMVGKYIEIEVKAGGGNTALDGVWFVPSDATVTVNSYKIYVSKIQKVTGYAKVPAGTTTTYPVSTNPNAYQEGDDAKAAGYVVGEVKTGTFAMATGNVQYSYASSVSVSDDGTVSLVSPSSTTLSADASSRTIALSMRGKYVKATSSLTNCGVPFSSGSVVFLPADAVVSGTVDIDRYQPVTGYAAIPAGTTIEYLGKLGDKARVQVVSYVGTGTYGENNPTVLNFSFVPKVFFVGTVNGYGNAAVAGCNWINTSSFPGTSARPGYVRFDGKKVSMYAQSNSMYYDANSSYNYSGYKYIAVAIG